MFHRCGGFDLCLPGSTRCRPGHSSQDFRERPGDSRNGPTLLTIRIKERKNHTPMCILCDPSRLEEAQALTILDCSGCPTLKIIPSLPNATRLDCIGCPLLTTLPSSLP